MSPASLRTMLHRALVSGNAAEQGGGGSGKNHTLHLGIARGHEEIEAAVHVGAVGIQGIGDGAGNGGDRRLVENIVYALAGVAHGIQVEEVAFAKVQAVPQFP